MAKNKANTAQAKAKLESIKMQAANEVGVGAKVLKYYTITKSICQ